MTTLITGRLTAKQFYEFCLRPENAGKRLELDEGKVIEMPPPGIAHGVVASWIAYLLWQYALHRGQGRVVTNDSGLIVHRDPDTVRGADIMFFDHNKPLHELPIGYAEELPLLVVEIVSPSDRQSQLDRRIEQYLRRGVPLLWIVYPEDQTVTIQRPNEIPRVLEGDDELTGNGVLPDFHCKVADLFRLPGQS